MKKTNNSTVAICKQMIRQLYFKNKIELREIAKILNIPISMVDRIQSSLIIEHTEKKKIFNYIHETKTNLGSKTESYYTEEQLLQGLPKYNLNDLEGDEKGILTLINNGQIKVEPLK